MVKILCNLSINAHLCHNGPQPKDSIKHASEEANFDCGLSGKQLENVAFCQKSLPTHDLNHNDYTPWYSNTLHTYMWDIVMFMKV